MRWMEVPLRNLRLNIGANNCMTKDMSKEKKKKVWVGYATKHWRVCCGFSGNEFILCEITKLKMSDATRKVKITVEEV